MYEVFSTNRQTEDSAYSVHEILYDLSAFFYQVSSKIKITTMPKILPKQESHSKNDKVQIA